MGWKQTSPIFSVGDVGLALSWPFVPKILHGRTNTISAGGIQNRRRWFCPLRRAKNGDRNESPWRRTTNNRFSPEESQISNVVRPPYESTHTSMPDLKSQSRTPTDTETLLGRKRVFHFWRCFWLTFLAISLAYAWYCFYVPGNSIAWAEDYPAAQQQAVASGKPIILYFTGEWCSPCRVMRRQVWADDEVKTLVNSQFIPVAIDVDNPNDAGVLARYKVGGAPVTIITDAEGNALRWRVGGIGKAEFLELLRATNPSPGNVF